MPGCASDWPAAADCSQETLSRYQDTGDWSLRLGSVSAETRSPGPGAGTEEMGSWARGSTFTCHLALFQINMKRDNGRYITPG